MVRKRENQGIKHKDMLNNLIEVSKINPDMTDEILYKTFVQFFGDGYESASQVNAMCMEDERSIYINIFA